MKLRKILKCWIFIGCLLISPVLLSLGQGNLVYNGGFDTSASGWTITNVANIGGYSSSAGDPPGSVFLYNPAFGDVSVPTASQEINGLTPVALYIVSGDYLGGGKDVTDNSFGVALDGVFLFETPAPPDLNWHSFSFEYTATSTSGLLSLSAQINGTDDAYYIDNIAMYATPEPSAVCFIFLGSGLLIGVRARHWRRKSQCRLSLGAGRQ